MTLDLENDSSRDFLDAVLGLRSVLARVSAAGEAEEAASLNEDDPVVLLLLGLLHVERSLNTWIQSLEDPAAASARPENLKRSDRLMR